MAEVQLECRICGGPFMAVRRTVMYCSRPCRSKANYAAKKARIARGRGAKIHVLEFDDSEAARRKRLDEQAFAQVSDARQQLVQNGYPIGA